MTKRSMLEEAIFNRISLAGFPLPEREYKFNDARRWRFDFAWPDIKLAIEAEGGVFTRGRHTRPMGFMKDAEKYNEAAKMGWIVMRYTIKSLDNVINDVEFVMKERGLK